MSEKVDVKKSLPSYRAKQGRFDVVDVPDLQYLMVDGHGDPNTSPLYREALEALYPVAYRLKFASKALGRDYVVPPLEGLWWADEMSAFTTARDKDAWHWTLMILTPDWIDQQLFESVRVDEVRLESLSEGRCVQTLHVGSFDDEGPVLERMHEEVVPEHGLQVTGKHHEIYLSDARRVEPSRLRTILRQPVTSVLTPRA
ncbi:GyrI-like domain-containing protein [Aeromicrobium alkaliterrae]|uniref:GyrI-like domain-containing protein n=1 Tax=Aeromicrobium alkaliterrae TaxID=302168 RepID=A0ABP4VNI9_9ACTN